MVRADLVANQSSLHWFEKGWKISITKQLYYSFVHFFKYRIKSTRMLEKLMILYLKTF